jgi:hypothetical protein
MIFKLRPHIGAAWVRVFGNSVAPELNRQRVDPIRISFPAVLLVTSPKSRRDQ